MRSADSWLASWAQEVAIQADGGMAALDRGGARVARGSTGTLPGVCVCQHVCTNACTGISFSCSDCMCTGKTNQNLFGCIGESPASCHEENKAIAI